MLCVTEFAFGKNEDLGRAHRENEADIAALVGSETDPGDNLVLPTSIPLRQPSCGQTCQRIAFGYRLGIALNNDVQTCLPAITAGRQDYVVIAAQIKRFLLLAASTKMQGVVDPNRDQRGDVGSAVSTDGRNPEQFCPSIARRVSSHPVAVASGSLYRVSREVTGIVTK